VRAEVQISVIVRAFNEAASLERCLEALSSQRVGGRGVELVVVDGGSPDATVEVAANRGALVVSMTPETFTYGGSLNLGCANARGELLVALSAHAFPPDRDWLARMTEPFADPLVACTCGARYGPTGAPLRAPVRQDLALAREHTDWGYSNAAGAFRADLWRKRPFRSDLPSCEDKEWARYWLERGYTCVVDPAFDVDHDHTHDALIRIYRRARVEAEGFAAFLKLGPPSPRELIREWWSDLRWYSSPARARVSHRRAARLLGAYAGRRRANRRQLRGERWG
jgi:rhamnosyltransferase